MKKIIIAIIIAPSVIFAGCGYRDINNLSLVIATYVDYDESNNNAIVYIEAFKPLRSSSTQAESDTKIYLKGTGKTISGALNNISLSSDYKLDFSQNKIIIYSKKLAQHGFDNFVDRFDRRQDFPYTAYIAIYDGESNTLFATDIKQEKYMSIFLRHLFMNANLNYSGFVTDIHQFFNRRFIGNHINVLPIILTNIQSGSTGMTINKYAVIKNYKLIGELSREEAFTLNLLTANKKIGYIETTNPVSSDTYITLNISKKNLKTNIQYDDNKIRVKKEITIHTSLWEVQGGLNLTKQNIKQIECNAEAEITEKAMKLFEDYKKNNIDILNVTDEFNRKYQFKSMDILNNSFLELKVNVTVDNPMIITNPNK